MRPATIPPSDGDCHTPLPCELRKGNDTTPRACSLYVRGGRMLVASTSVSGSNLALLPPPTLRERRHRGLARRLVASARAYVGFERANVAEYTSPRCAIARAAGP